METWTLREKAHSLAVAINPLASFERELNTQVIEAVLRQVAEECASVCEAPIEYSKYSNFDYHAMRDVHFYCSGQIRERFGLEDEE